jgi:hypothetical protein
MPAESKLRITIPPNENALVSFQIPLALKRKAEERAEERKVSFSLFMRRAVKLYADFSPAAWEEVERLADAFAIEESRVIENILLRYVAEQEAFEQVHGPDTNRVASEFSRTQKGTTLASRDLIEKLRGEFVTAFTLMKKATEGPGRAVKRRIPTKPA